jgi:hypothetical protein
MGECNDVEGTMPRIGDRVLKVENERRNGGGWKVLS